MLQLFLLGLAMYAWAFIVATLRAKLYGRTKITAKLFGDKKHLISTLINYDLSSLFWLMLAVTCLEELIFRLGGIALMTWGFGNQLFFLIASSVIFGITHMRNLPAGNGGRGFIALIHVGTGLTMGYVFIKYGFFAAWAFHLIYNMVAISIARLRYKFIPGSMEKDYEIV